MLLIRLPETKSYAIRRKNKKTPSDQLMAEVLVSLKVNDQFEFQTAGTESPVFEQFICQEVTEVYKDGETFYAILAQGAF